ncbi:uncharacterized protein FOMMEDRAFT_148691 [Fomitiporia mediterranea MF3/22]|uniref:uncharacterized protein n=1 Tax=Fomitiporia mediterranea (strain MF3/22) TaxID=694068 RepID=UPI0004409A74|nr:uncharacterized protein FOMMEDRAFT_148691 [Fomitiporia mediterranea MF3/22]EJC99517.1 hypothetical protein FOMMEDRAFT_148691 [Fomitiporia mediterranea MF3/22]
MSAPISQAFKPGTLYAVLLYRGDPTPTPNTWHCALFLPSEPLPNDPPSTLRGTAWHCTNKNTSELWAYEELAPDQLLLNERLVLGARLADLSPLGEHADVASELSLILRAVPVRPEAHSSVFNARTWMLDGIGELDDGGFLSCVSTLALESELVSAAGLAMQKYMEDGSYVMITPRNCSDS